MSKHDETAIPNGIVNVIVVAALGGLFFSLRVVAGMVVRAYSRHGRHPLLVGLAASWGTALIMAFGLFLVAASVALALIVAGLTTAIFVAAVGVGELVIEHRSPPATIEDDSVSGQLGSWWQPGR